jgi:probable F420-dependent oxidoreductase
MKFGANILNFGPALTPDAFVEWVTSAERVGFQFAMVSDHVAITGDVAELGYPAPFYDPLVALGLLVGVTQRIELGTSALVVPYRHPLLTARMVANLDQFSGGRIIFGVGVGWAEAEFEALGVEYRRRGSVTDEYLRAIELAWREELISFSGEFVAFSAVQSAPAPVRRPRPPIWVGGNGRSAARRAARFGDAWHPIRFGPGWLQSFGVPTLRDAAAELGREPPPIAPRIFLAIGDARLADEERLVGQGTAEQVRADLRELESLGVEHVLFDTRVDGQPVTSTAPHRAMLERAAAEVVDLATGTVR